MTTEKRNEVRPLYTYDERILAALAIHGLVPRPDTAPQVLRDAVGDLYRYEIRRLRRALLAGRIRKLDYAGRVVELRKRYWVLSVPVGSWARRTGEGLQGTGEREKINRRKGGGENQ